MLKLMVSMPNTLPYIMTAAHESLMGVVSPPAFDALNEVLGAGEWMFLIDRQTGYPMHFNRNCSCAAVLESEADFWITFDADMTFPVTVLADLMRVMVQGGESYDPAEKVVRRVEPEEIDVLSGLYFKKAPPFPPVNGVFTRDDKPYWHSPINTEWKGLVRNDVIGAGCMCVRPSALRQIGFPWFKYQELTDLKGRPGISSEDVWFCQRAKEDGVRVWTDTRIACEHMTGFAAGLQLWDQYKYGTAAAPGLFDRETGALRMELLDEETRRRFTRDSAAWPGMGPR